MVIFHHIPDCLGYITIELIHVSHVKPHVRFWLQRITVVASNSDSYRMIFLTYQKRYLQELKQEKTSS
jgi:hypothetical protein